VRTLTDRGDVLLSSGVGRDKEGEEGAAESSSRLVCYFGDFWEGKQKCFNFNAGVGWIKQGDFIERDRGGGRAVNYETAIESR